MARYTTGPSASGITKHTYQARLVVRLTSAVRVKNCKAVRRLFGERALRERAAKERTTSHRMYDVSSACRMMMGHAVPFQWNGKMPSE